jgi:hypothetical protein
MDIGSLAASVSTDALATVQGVAQVAVLKKAMQMQAQSAAQLVEALPQPQPVAPGQPGAIVNTYA